MRSLLRRYSHLSASRKRLYSLLTLITLVALLLYCLGLGGFLLRSRLVSDLALELPPTFTATSTPQSTTPATPGPTGTPTATLPPTPTQRPIPTYTPTPETVNITVVITSTEGLTSTMVISATVTPTPVLTATVTITAEASLGALSLVRPMGSQSGATTSPGLEIASKLRCSACWSQAARNVLPFRLTSGQDSDSATCLLSAACRAPTSRQTPARTPQYG